MNNPFSNREVWFLTGSQSLYGPETLSQVAENSTQLVTTLNESGQLPVKIIWQPVLTDAETIRRTMLAANHSDTCVGVITWMHTFSPAKMWLSGLNLLTKPLLHLHTQTNVELPWSTIDMDFMNLNQSAHGDREFGYAAARLNLSRKIVVGHVSNHTVQRKIATWLRACVGWAELHTLRLARFGDNMRNVAVTEGDKTEAEIRLGVSVNTWGVNDLVAAVQQVPSTEVHDLVEEYLDSYQVAPELLPGNTRHDSLCEAARIEAGLRSFLIAGEFNAFTTNFEDLGGLRQLPGLAVQRLMAQGYGFGAEGDWKTAILVRLCNVMGYGLPGGASLMEDYTYELTPGLERILGAHMLEISPALTKSRPRLEIHPLSIGNREDPVRLVFDADCGPAIVVAMTDLGARFRLVANQVQIVGPTEPLINLPVARAVWIPKPNFATATECWLAAGAAHHTAMTSALNMEHLIDFAEIANLELAIIDADTSVRSFSNELRWNQLYHRLTD